MTQTLRLSALRAPRSYNLQYQDLPYTKAFWNNYKVIKDTPLDKKILEDLEKADRFKNSLRGNIDCSVS